MKAFFSKYKWKLLIAFAVFIVLIPFAINCLFKITLHCDVGDVLTFYGEILASTATIFGVYYSIEYAQRNYRKDEANRVRPYFALTRYKIHSKSSKLLADLLSSTADTDRTEQLQNYYEEYRSQKVYIFVDQSGISYKEKLSDNQQQLLKSGGWQWKIANGCTVLQANAFCSLLYEAENVGNGAAINTMISFYKKGDKCSGFHLYTIKKGDSFYFHIFCDDAKILEGSDYIIELRYGDIIGNYYSQKYPVVRTAVDLSGTQEITNIGTEDE